MGYNINGILDFPPDVDYLFLGTYFQFKLAS